MGPVRVVTDEMCLRTLMVCVHIVDGAGACSGTAARVRVGGKSWTKIATKV